MAIKRNLEIFERSDVTLAFTIDEAITGWTLSLIISNELRDTTPTVTQSAVLVDGAAGTCTVTRSAAQTALTPGVYWYELVRTNVGAADVFTRGQLTVLPRVGA